MDDDSHRWLMAEPARLVRSMNLKIKDLAHLNQQIRGSIPRHRTVLGVDCEAYAWSLPSTFNQNPVDMAGFILRLVGLPVEKFVKPLMLLKLFFGVNWLALNLRQCHGWTENDDRARKKANILTKWLIRMRHARLSIFAKSLRCFEPDRLQTSPIPR
jgi:hypothetical protein